jgi:hypothetical protein
MINENVRRDLPCDTAGLEQLRERAILAGLPGVSDESSWCLLFIFVIAPQFEVLVVDALLSVIKKHIHIKAMIRH